MKKIVCPTCNGKGFYYAPDEFTPFKKFCEICKGKGLIMPGEPYKRFKNKVVHW